MPDFVSFNFNTASNYIDVTTVPAETGGPWAYTQAGSVNTENGGVFLSSDGFTSLRAAASASGAYGTEVTLKSLPSTTGWNVFGAIRADAKGGGYSACLVSTSGTTATPSIRKGPATILAKGPDVTITAASTFGIRERSRSEVAVVLEMLVDGVVVLTAIDWTSTLPETGRIMFGFGNGSGGDQYKINSVRGYDYVPPIKQGKLSVVGDSITYGAGATTGQGLATGNSYPGQLASRLGSTWSVTNFGVAGDTIDQMSARRAAIDTNYDATYAENWIAFLGGTNNLFQHESAEVVYGKIRDFCIASKAANPGIKIAVSTIPASNASYEPAFNDRAADINTKLRQNYRQFADRLIPFAENILLNDPTNAVISLDKTHFTDAGQSLQADVAYPVLIGATSAESSTTLSIVQATPMNGLPNQTSGETGLATTSDAAITVLSANVSGAKHSIALTNEGLVSGFYSIDGATTWHRFPPGRIVLNDVLSKEAVLVKRTAGGSNVTGVYASASL